MGKFHPFRQRLKALGLTQAELAARLGVTRETIGRRKDDLEYVEAYLSELERRQRMVLELREVVERWGSIQGG